MNHFMRSIWNCLINSCRRFFVARRWNCHVLISLGKKEYKGDKLKIEDNTILILEGIHALNPALTPHIPAERKFKIYVSALTTISLDDHNWIPTTDNRLLRRIIRDFNYRGYSARETISRCLVYVPVKTNGYSLIRKMLMSCLIQRYFLSLPYFVYTLSLF